MGRKIQSDKWITRKIHKRGGTSIMLQIGPDFMIHEMVTLPARKECAFLGKFFRIRIGLFLIGILNSSASVLVRYRLRTVIADHRHAVCLQPVHGYAGPYRKFRFGTAQGQTAGNVIDSDIVQRSQREEKEDRKGRKGSG